MPDAAITHNQMLNTGLLTKLDNFDGWVYHQTQPYVLAVVREEISGYRSIFFSGPVAFFPGEERPKVWKG